MTDRKKRCTRCQRWLPEADFYPIRSRGRDAEGRFQRAPKCKACEKQHLKERYHQDPDAARERQRARARARSRAYIKLTRIFPERYEELLAEELEKEQSNRG